MSKKQTVELYTDGSAAPNPGFGGWCALLRMPVSGKVDDNGKPIDVVSKCFQGHATDTTNNRMELGAVLVGLSKLKRPCFVQLYTDSKYVINGIRSAEEWKARKWRTRSGREIKNADLWRRTLPLLRQHEVHCHWVQGHSGNRWNEFVDQIAVKEREYAAAKEATK